MSGNINSAETCVINQIPGLEKWYQTGILVLNASTYRGFIYLEEKNIDMVEEGQVFFTQPLLGFDDGKGDN